ncbi:MAG: glycerol-3-phosphate 1-O-acyltransferase PlsY [Lachnospiraceae bacterium]
MIVGITLLAIVIGYFLGCFQTAYLVGKKNNIDIREHGSGNAGTTNALRTLGVKSAVITFAGDLLKGFIAVFIARYFLAPMVTQERELITAISLFGGFGAVLGHNFPFNLQFRGGKGMATTAAVILAFDWKMAIIFFVGFCIIVGVTRYVSLGSVLVLIAFPIMVAVFYPGEYLVLFCAILFAGLGVIRHRNNIVRIVHGTENKLSFHKQEEV